MKNIKFIQIYKDNQELYQKLLPQWLDYMKEIGQQNDEDITDYDKTIHGLNRRINIQGNRPDMHFELLFCDDSLIGFSNFAIDTGGISGLIEKGYGTVMEFYITPEFRHKGYGKLFYEHIEETLKSDGAEHIYIVTTKPFWLAMGFDDTGKIDPDDNLPIYLKKVSHCTE